MSYLRSPTDAAEPFRTLRRTNRETFFFNLHRIHHRISKSISSFSPHLLSLALSSRSSLRGLGAHHANLNEASTNQTVSRLLPDLAKTGRRRWSAQTGERTTTLTETPRTSSMAMVSPRLQHDIDRRIRAAYSLDVDRGLRGDTHRSSSVPAALRHHRGQEPNRAMTAPAGYRGRRGSTARPRLIFLDKHVRTARSVSPPSKQRRHVERPRARSPLITEPVASVLGDEVPLTSEDGSSGTGAEDESVGGPGMAADEKAGSGDKEGTVASDFGAPKLMELMEERDRAVHLCLQVPALTSACLA